MKYMKILILNKKLKWQSQDLETMGDGSNSVICSIGAVTFNIVTGETGEEFYKQIDIQSCLDINMIVNGSTIMWWLKQNERARMKIANGNGVGIKSALLDFNDYIDNHSPTIQIWGNGARFDIGILSDAYRACKLKPKWDFRCERDVRTLVSFVPEIKENYPKIGIEHSPIDDCKYQIGYCVAIWRKLNNLTTLTNIEE
jgi:hypothetical protein